MLVRHLSESQKKGPESRLIQKALQSQLPFEVTGSLRLLREPNMPTGFPDLVLAFHRSTKGTSQACKRSIGVTDLKLLYHLYAVRKSTVDELEQKLAWKKEALEAALKKLAKAHLIYVNGSSVRFASVRKSFVVSRIIAIEAKIRHWRKALEQAVANTWFASHSYILIPESGVIDRISEAATKFGIGVLVFNGQSTKEVIKPSTYKIPSSYGSWLINEWVLNGSLMRRDRDRRKCCSTGLSGA
jgi:predicted transcriptional regulator